jgi:D-alanine-D-alanine ligase
MRDNIGKFIIWLQDAKPDLIINLCEGYNGIPQLEPNVAAVFELLGIPYTGNNSKVLSLCQDKYKTKVILDSYGLQTPRCFLVSSSDQIPEITFPLIVKPNNEDGSLGVGINAVVFNKKELQDRVERIVDNYEQAALVEEYIDGREFNIAIYDNSEPKALPASEIDFSKMPSGAPHICSYEAKWHEGSVLFIGTPPICPARIDSFLMENLQQNALKAFRVLGCRDYARVDFRVSDDGTNFILEVNPNPDISKSAGYARALAAAGIDYKKFWESIIKKTKRRKQI